MPGPERTLTLLVAKAGAGSMRDSLSLLDRLLSVGEKDLTSEMIEQLLGLPKTQLIFDLAQAIGEGDVKSVLTRVETMTAQGLSRAAVAVVAALLMTANAFVQAPGVPRTPWGDPDLQGTFTNKDEVGTPLERPREFEGRRVEDFPPAEVAAILKKRDEDRPRVQADASGRIGPT